MRLTCPNCDAEYEVEASAIPAAGRDVQCSACGHGWFQKPAPAPRLAQLSPHPAEDLPRRSVDESVLAVLREEAEREAAARRSERPALETQTELALAEAPKPRPPQDDEPPFDTRPHPAPAAPKASPLPPPPLASEPPRRPEPSRKGALLPKIDEVKSALNPVFAPRPVPEPAPSASDGFRSGFVFAILIAVICLALYVLAPLIMVKIPATAPAMTAYVDFIDHSRRQLNEGLRTLIDWLRAQAQGAKS